jgi:hypothetical protein
MLIQALFVACEVTCVVVPILPLIVFGGVVLLYRRARLDERCLRLRREQALASCAWEFEKVEKLELWQKDLRIWRATLTPREVSDLIVFVETRPRLMAGRRCFYSAAFFEFPVLPTDLNPGTSKAFPTMHDEIVSALAEFENMRAARRWQREHAIKLSRRLPVNCCHQIRSFL